ncbi:hypothetical protein TH25_22335 [Thalassospira profundimaris]|uniref:Nucleoside transporter/FeoB GTPase Gate domain-containing protein n=1 Tax=Thalassospira profundimaris TaxID=502049 RepID=A0A367WNN4_9PROT|nr:nucleoside recognition domain-containing protein [Thalassospira profundimaris]RCK43086.1 hypothetical protein TH25_22335 [Thalassospira profundimaris]
MPPYLISLLTRSRRLFITLAKVMVPIMLAVRIAEQLGLVEMASSVLTPVMALIGMPPEAGLIWASCLFINIYGAVAVIAGLAPHLDMTSAQLSALCAMMLFAHGIPVEQAVVKKAGASFWATAALRIFTALFYAAFITWISRHTGLLGEKIDLSWMAANGSDAISQTGWAGWFAWAEGTFYSLLASFAIIAGLLVLLDILEKTGITERFTTALLPVLRISGLSRAAAPVTTIGILLGLTYGGALIIDEARQKNFPPRTLFLALSWLSLSHSLIEDTVIMLALGANIWVVLVGRVVLTLIIMILLARFTRRWQTAKPQSFNQQPQGAD